MKRPDEKRALKLLREFLARRFRADFHCERNKDDPPDLVATLPGGARWGVEVTNVFLEVERLDNSERVSSVGATAHLDRFASGIGKKTAGLRKRNYRLFIGPGHLTLFEPKPRLFDSKWKQKAEQEIVDHVASGKTCVLRGEAFRLIPGEPGTDWDCHVSPGVSNIGMETASMLHRALSVKASGVPSWNGDFDERWLLLLNNYPLGDDVDDAGTILRNLIQNDHELRQFDGILWSGMVDPTLVEIPLSADP